MLDTELKDTIKEIESCVSEYDLNGALDFVSRAHDLSLKLGRSTVEFEKQGLIIRILLSMN